MSNDAKIYAELTEIFNDVFMKDDMVLTPELSAKDVQGWDSFKQIEIMDSVEEALSYQAEYQRDRLAEMRRRPGERDRQDGQLRRSSVFGRR